MTDDVPTVEGGAPTRAPSLVRSGCAALLLLGLLSPLVAARSLVNPAGVRCSLARELIKEADTDKLDWNDPDIGTRDRDDLSCPEAIAVAEKLPEKEDGKETVSLPGESAVRIPAIFILLVGLGQAVTAFLTARTLSRKTRTAALGFASLGILLPVLGIVSLVLLVFVAYSIGFSAASQQVWPRRPRHRH